MYRTALSKTLDLPPSGGRSGHDVFEWLEQFSDVGCGRSPSFVSALEAQLLGSDRQWRMGRVEGISPTDLLADFAYPVLLGELVAVRLHSPVHGQSADCLGLVHWRQRYLGRYLIGVFLREPLPEALLSHFWTDSRQELRYPARKVIRARFESARTKRDVTVLNYSRSGVCLQSEHRPNSGERIELYHDEAELAGGAVRFVRPVQRGGGFQFGCQLEANQGLPLSRAIQGHEAGGYDFWLQAPEPGFFDEPNPCSSWEEGAGLPSSPMRALLTVS